MGGSCSFSKKSAGTTINIIKLSNTNRNNTNRQSQSNRGLLNGHQIENNNNNNSELFKDFPELEGDEYIGEGIKKIKSYKCDIPLDKLAEYRYNFWASQKTNRRVWQILKNVCETDNLTAEQLLTSANLVALDGCLRCVVDPYTGVVYNIPNYCITDPVYKKQFDKQILQKEEKIIHLDLLYVFMNKIHEVKVSNKITGLELKELFCKLENIDIEQHKIRLLSKGQEVKDDTQLCLFNINEGDKIQVSCFKLEEIEL